METTKNPKYDQLEELSSALDKLLGFQREEQEAILNRETKRLPEISAKVEDLMERVERLERGLSGFWPGHPLPAPWDGIGSTCIGKLKDLQEITLQNHMLLENSLRFLNEVFQEVIGTHRTSSVYNHFGSVSGGFAGSGLFVNTRA